MKKKWLWDTTKNFLVVLALLIGSAAYSQTPDFTFGITGSLNTAVNSELKESAPSLGTGLGANVALVITPQHSIKLRYDGIKFPTSSQYFTSGYEIITESKVDVFELNYTYTFKSGWFGQIGMGNLHWVNIFTQKFPPKDTRGVVASSSDVDNSAMTFGFGYQIFSKTGMLQSATFEIRYINGGPSSRIVQTGVGFNF